MPDDQPPPPNLTYPDGWDAVIAKWEARRAPYRMRGSDALLPLDADLAPLMAERVPVPRAPGEKASSFATKRHALAQEFVDQPKLALENAMVISCLRRREWPDHAPALFRRIWTEQGAALIGVLNARWLISSVITFADFGATESERFLGQSMKMLFKLVKLYEYERLYSGLAPTEAFGIDKPSHAPLPMQINGFSLRDGGLDINLLAPIWKQAAAEPVMGPLACAMLQQLNADPGTVLRRIALMREALFAQKEARRARRTGAQADPTGETGQEP